MFCFFCLIFSPISRRTEQCRAHLSVRPTEESGPISILAFRVIIGNSWTGCFPQKSPVLLKVTSALSLHPHQPLSWADPTCFTFSAGSGPWQRLKAWLWTVQALQLMSERLLLTFLLSKSNSHLWKETTEWLHAKRVLIITRGTLSGEIFPKSSGGKGLGLCTITANYHCPPSFLQSGLGTSMMHAVTCGIEWP